MKTGIRNRESGVRSSNVSLLTSAATAVLAVVLLSGCGTLDRAYSKQVTWTNAPVVQVVTNTVVATNLVAQVVERTNVVLVTNAATGGITGYATREPVATNLVTVLVTNLVPVFQTNFVSVPVTNLVPRPEAEAAIQAAGSGVNTFAPGIGSILALVLGGKTKLEEVVLPCGVAAGLAPVLILINDQEFTKTANCWGVDNNFKGTNTNRIVVFNKV